MDTSGHEQGKLLHRDLVNSKIGSALGILREVGHGLHEHSYENALAVELGLRTLHYDPQRKYSVVYKGVKVAEFVPDLVVPDSVIVDAKAIERITDFERGQMLNYLRSPSSASGSSSITKSRNSNGHALFYD